MRPLYQTHRPTALDGVVGQAKAVATCRHLAARGLGGNAMWISGAKGTGKTTIARIMAGTLADVFHTVEVDAGKVTAEFLRQADVDARYAPLSGDGRAYIVNEAHGLTARAMRTLDVMLEALPESCVWIFTTTSEGQADLFESYHDAGPLLDRCLRIPLTTQGLCKAFAKRAREIAELEGLNGRPLAAYERLLKDNHNSMRGAMEDIQAGRMLQSEG